MISAVLLVAGVASAARATSAPETNAIKDTERAARRRSVLLINPPQAAQAEQIVAGPKFVAKRRGALALIVRVDAILPKLTPIVSIGTYSWFGFAL